MTSFPQGQLYAGKDETHGIERDNARRLYPTLKLATRGRLSTPFSRSSFSAIASMIQVVRAVGTTRACTDGIDLGQH